MPTRTAALDRVPAPALFVVSGLTQYLGAAIAVGLFAVAGAVEVGWLRIAASALLLLAWRRAWRRRWARPARAWGGGGRGAAAPPPRRAAITITLGNLGLGAVAHA